MTLPALVTLPVPVTDRDVHAYRDLLELPEDTGFCCLAPDRQGLTDLELTVMDDGDLLPSWGTWWLSLAAELAYGRLRPAAFLKIGKNRFGRLRLSQTALTVSEVAVELVGSGASSTGAFCLVWGLDPAARPSRKVRCAGAVFPVADNAAAALFLSPPDRAILRPWLPSPLPVSPEAAERFWR